MCSAFTGICNVTIAAVSVLVTSGLRYSAEIYACSAKCELGAWNMNEPCPQCLMLKGLNVTVTGTCVCVRCRNV